MARKSTRVNSGLGGRPNRDVRHTSGLIKQEKPQEEIITDEENSDVVYNSIVSTGTQANLNAEKVNNIKLYVLDILLQKEIGNILNSCDLKLLLEIEKYEKLQKLKKEFMQSMFV